MKVQIKNMVTNHCIQTVRAELNRMGLKFNYLELGEVDLMNELSTKEYQEFKLDLFKSGFELIENKASVLVEKIKNMIIQLVHNSEEEINIKFSEYLSAKLNYDYNYLSNLFSASEGISIRHFIILHKVERIKELISYNELSISEIAWKLHYSSVSHLSNQFKKIT